MKGMDIQSYLSLTGISAPFFDFELRLLALQLRQSTFGGFWPPALQPACLA